MACLINSLNQRLEDENDDEDNGENDNDGSGCC